MIQPLVVHAVESEGGAQHACEAAAAHLAALLATHVAQGARVLGALQMTTNLVVSIAGITTYHVTLAILVDLPGAEFVPSDDPRDPAEWRALARDAAGDGAPGPAIPPAAPGSPREEVETARLVAAGAPAPNPPVPEALAARHAEIRTIMEALRWKPEHARDFLWKWRVHRITELDARGAESVLAALRKKAAEVA